MIDKKFNEILKNIIDNKLSCSDLCLNVDKDCKDCVYLSKFNINLNERFEG